MTLAVPDPIVSKVTGHRSRELERYQRLAPEVRALTVSLFATELCATRAQKTGAQLLAHLTRGVSRELCGTLQPIDWTRESGGVDGTRTQFTVPR
jgi:hypothetical protein